MKCFMMAVCASIVSGVVYADDPSPERIREIAVRNLEIEPRYLIKLCDEKFNVDWCKGYYSSTIITLLENGKKLCLPVNDVGRYSFDGVWTITKSWLYKQDKEKKIDFYQAVKNSLSEEMECQN